MAVLLLKAVFTLLVDQLSTIEKHIAEMVIPAQHLLLLVVDRCGCWPKVLLYF